MASLGSSETNLVVSIADGDLVSFGTPDLTLHETLLLVRNPARLLGIVRLRLEMNIAQDYPGLHLGSEGSSLIWRNLRVGSPQSLMTQ